MHRQNKTPVKYGPQEVEILARDPLYRGFLSLTRYRFRHRLFNGEMSGEITREVLERGHAAVLIPYDPITDQVVLIEQIRIAALTVSPTPWLLELVAGMVEEQESVEQVCRRETMEEAGLTVNRIKPVLSYLTSPGGTSERVSIFIGEVDSTQATGTHGLAEENEDILVHVASREQAHQWVQQGVIDNGASIIGIQWLMLHWQTLRQEWHA